MSVTPMLRLFLIGLLLACSQVHALVNFQFQYIDPEGEGFNDKSAVRMREAIEEAGSILGGWIAQNATVRLSIKMDNNQNALASAYSYLGWNGQNRMVSNYVRDKIVHGRDFSRGGVDGNISVNLNNKWNIGDGRGKYNFKSVLFHEMTHALGFAPGGAAVRKLCNKEQDDDGRRYYTLFETFLQNEKGGKLIKLDGTVDEAFDCGRKLYFSGPRAVEAYGGPIPLYSPAEYEEGSSYSHLDYMDRELHGSMMLHYAGHALEWNVYERAVMEDLGYQIACPMAEGGSSCIHSYFEGEISSIPEYSAASVWVGLVAFVGVIGYRRIGR